MERDWNWMGLKIPSNPTMMQFVISVPRKPALPLLTALRRALFAALPANSPPRDIPQGTHQHLTLAGATKAFPKPTSQPIHQHWQQPHVFGRCSRWQGQPGTLLRAILHHCYHFFFLLLFPFFLSFFSPSHLA